MLIHQIRNATIILFYGGKRILVDPWLQKKGTGFIAPTPYADKRIPSPTCDLPIRTEDIIRKNDAVLVTHIHPDHFDMETSQMLGKAVPMLVQNEDDKRTLLDMGYTDVRVIEKSGTSFCGITIYRTDGMHGPSPESRAGEASGFVFKASNEKTLYIAGDTVFFEGVSAALETYKPQVIVLNSCAAVLDGVGRLIMDCEDVAKVCAHAPDAQIIASHMEAVNHATVNRAELAEYLSVRGLMKNVKIPSDGEKLYF